MPLINHAGRDRLSPLGLILLAVTSVGWGLNFPIMKHLLTEWPPLSSRGLSGIAGAAALALFALARRQKLSVPRPMWLRLLLVSMLPLSLAGWQIGLGCLPIAIVGLAVEQPQLAALSYVGWASLLYMTLIQFCLCYVCWFAALERLPAATASIGTLLVPVIGVLAAAAMLREPLGLREIAALVFTLGGVAVALRAYF